jgi:hypothetical protein
MFERNGVPFELKVLDLALHSAIGLTVKAV